MTVLGDRRANRTVGQAGSGLAAVVDRVIPGTASRLETAAGHLHRLAARVFGSPGGRAVAVALRGNEWLGHPAHPIAVTVPIGAWTTAAWFDVRSLRPAHRDAGRAADKALLLGVVAALPAAATGVVQFLDTSGQARRQTVVHAALNYVALSLAVASSAARAAGRRRWGRRLSAIALVAAGISGFLGGDLVYRHGVGVAPGPVHSASRPAGVAT